MKYEEKYSSLLSKNFNINLKFNVYEPKASELIRIFHFTISSLLKYMILNNHNKINYIQIHHFFIFSSNLFKFEIS